MAAVDGEYVSGDNHILSESESSSSDSHYRKKLSGYWIVETTEGKYVISYLDNYQDVVMQNGMDDIESQAIWQEEFTTD